jgi:hypothetical protein
MCYNIFVSGRYVVWYDRRFNMKVTPMVIIKDIQKQVIDGKYRNLIKIFNKVVDEAFFNGKNTVTDSDFEYFKDELEGYGVYVTWDAIAKFFGVKF